MLLPTYGTGVVSLLEIYGAPASQEPLLRSLMPLPKIYGASAKYLWYSMVPLPRTYGVPIVPSMVSLCRLYQESMVPQLPDTPMVFLRCAFHEFIIPIWYPS